MNELKLPFMLRSKEMASGEWTGRVLIELRSLESLSRLRTKPKMLILVILPANRVQELYLRDERGTRDEMRPCTAVVVQVGDMVHHGLFRQVTHS